MKQLICAAVMGALFLTAAGAAHAPETSAQSVVLMDADSGRVLYERGGDEQRLIASITKLMTALVAVESGHALDEVVTIKREWTGIEGSSLYLKEGEQLPLETLLYGLLLRSGNDAAHAIAGYCGGDVQTFVEQMNVRARELGMKNSHFANPSGLNAQGHYSSARDMAVLARECLANDTLSTIVSTRSITLGSRIFTNHNKLLWQYEGCIGLKTGYTEKAGRTLVSAAQRDGMTLICVTLNAPNDWKDHASLFDYGFTSFERRCLARAGDLLCQIPVEGSLLPLYQLRAGDDLWAAVEVGAETQVQLEPGCSVLTAPLKAGEQVGEAVFLSGGTELLRIPLRTDTDITCDLAPERTGIARLFGR